MARPRKGFRVRGPYRCFRRWRIELVGPDGTREVVSCATRDEAEKAAKVAWKKIPGLTHVEAVLQRYEKELRQRGNKGRTIDTTIMRLRNWHDEPDTPLSSITADDLRKRYKNRQGEVAVDTHRNELAQVKTFWRWCVKNGLVRKSPAEDIEPMGRRRRGKKQLRGSEARALFEEASKNAAKGDKGALAVLSVLLLGVRSSELLNRQVRDLDEGPDGFLLWIDEGKTEAAARFLEVPEPLAGMLHKLVEGREPTDFIFQGEPNEHRRVNWLRRAVRRLCKAAGVPEVTAHGLRGTWATLTSEAGVSAHIVSRELGHASQQVTQRHYKAPGTDDRARTKKMLKVVKGGKS